MFLTSIGFKLWIKGRRIFLLINLFFNNNLKWLLTSLQSYTQQALKKVFKCHSRFWMLLTHFGSWSRRTFVHWHRNWEFSLLFPGFPRHPLTAHHYDYRRLLTQERAVDYLNYVPNQFVAKFSIEQLQLQLRIRFPIFFLFGRKIFLFILIKR